MEKCINIQSCKKKRIVKKLIIFINHQTLDDIKYSVIGIFSNFLIVDGDIDAVVVLIVLHNLSFEVNCLSFAKSPEVLKGSQV